MKAINEALNKYEKLILDAERYIWANPETGYKEYKTSAYMAEKFCSLGYTLTMAEEITGFITEIDTGRPGPVVLVLGELDSVICPTHPECNPETGAVHSCGHHAQCAALLGIAAALKEDGVIDGLSGKIRLCAVPAEELLEIEYRSELKAQGKIKYLGGKSEFLSRGLFDGVDIAFMVHTGSRFLIRRGSVGCLTKRIIYKGKAAHAGGSPEAGINALYAASCGLNAVNSIRETFVDEEYIRVHPIITAGGSIVNAIPDTAMLESYVRGKTYEAVLRENKKVNRAFVGAALSLGANVEIIDAPGYAPLNNDYNMMLLARDAIELSLPGTPYAFLEENFSKGSTDMGDLSCIMPVVHPYAAGCSGSDHGSDYYITNPYTACVDSARWQLCMLKLLLENGAKRAKDIIKSFKPLFASKEEYLEYVDSINCNGNRIEYGNNKATIIL
ncbi:MAG: amidohydrolase [Clostridia bacterium]|nr:amidohydrolase [Clostridia bacterium]